MTTHVPRSINRKRRAGVLLHPTSLPVSRGNGDLGHQAYRFIEFLNHCGFKVWQMLPIGPTHEDKSPYQCLSSHAGSPLLISLEWLQDKGWLDLNQLETESEDDAYRYLCLRQAADNFYASDDKDWLRKLAAFTIKHQHWLDDYALYSALKIRYKNKPWYEWPKEVRHREANALRITSEELQQEIKQTLFEQFVFFTQWHEIREYAKQHKVELFGDMPIFVAHDSADVWASRENFLMDTDGNMSVVAGVPPDAFSETGQLWGNPLYDWGYIKTHNFDWWQQRFATLLDMFDIVRVDHFRGLQACWEIPASETTAMDGIWVEVPGKEMLEVLFKRFDSLPLVAEDLGVITPQVIALKNAFNLPGMKVLQFAFDGNNKNPHLPHRHRPRDLVYSGTHDNDTTLGWLRDTNHYNNDFFHDYLNCSTDDDVENVWDIISSVLASVSFMSILPMQDLLLLDTNSRMNVPGTSEKNWLWRFDWQQLEPGTREKIAHLIDLYER